METYFTVKGILKDSKNKNSKVEYVMPSYESVDKFADTLINSGDFLSIEIHQITDTKIVEIIPGTNK